MNREDRNRLSRFETILRRVDDAERDAMVRLRDEGYGFTSLDAARDQRTILRQLAASQAINVSDMASLLRPRNAHQGERTKK